MLCVSDFVDMYEKQRVEKGWANKEIQHIFDSNKAKQEIYYTLLNAKIINCHFQHFMESCEEKGLLKLLKEYGLYNMKGRGDNRAVWASPYIFCYLAMNMNPEIYGQVVVWLTDSLIINRIEASQNYRPMNEAIHDFIGDDRWNYVNTARLINTKIFGSSEAGQRAIATKSQLAKISDIEKFITASIKMKYIKDMNGIKQAVNDYF